MPNLKTKKWKLCIRPGCFRRQGIWWALCHKHVQEVNRAHLASHAD